MRNASVWVQLDHVLPDLAPWSAYFAAGSAKRRAAEAGITRLISRRDADELIREVMHFLDLVDRTLPAAA